MNFDITINNESIYLATARGINEVSLLGNILVPDVNELFKDFINKEVYKFEVQGDILYVMSELGLSSIDFDKKSINHLINKTLKDFEINNNKIFINDDRIWEIINKDNIFYKNLIYDQGNDFCVTDHFLWVNFITNVKLININNGAEWIYSNKDGIYGDIIYTMDCNNDWIWFGTNNGVYFYNWKKFH